MGRKVGKTKVVSTISAWMSKIPVQGNDMAAIPKIKIHEQINVRNLKQSLSTQKDPFNF